MTLPSCWNKYPATEVPLLLQQRQEWSQNKPLAGVRILHNVPLTIETLLKVDCLQQAGAIVTLTRTQFIRPLEDAALHAMVAELAVEYIPEHADLLHRKHEFDFVLDCGAQLLGIIEPKKGFVELTGSGTALFKRHANSLKVPALSIDDSKLKQLETFFGTADGFIRGYQQFSPMPLDDQSVIVFGYGKVGRGIVYGLSPFTKNISIVDCDPCALTIASKYGLNAIHPKNTENLHQAVKNAQVIVAAAGKHNCIGEVIPPALLRNKILVNMSAEDDFGPEISAMEVLGAKQPINFLLQSPTLMRYLDPSFYAHNLAALLILNNQLAPGYHPLSKVEDDKIVTQWQKLFNDDLSLLLTE